MLSTADSEIGMHLRINAKLTTTKSTHAFNDGVTLAPAATVARRRCCREIAHFRIANAEDGSSAWHG